MPIVKPPLVIREAQSHYVRPVNPAEEHMMVSRSGAALAMLAAFLIAAKPAGLSAAVNPALSADILHLALDWEHIKFEVENADEQEKEMAALAERAAGIVQQHQNQPEATIWLGILISEQASMANENSSPIRALRLAMKARDILEQAEKVDPVALDAGAPTSLGVLYYRVPGFPLGFGDKVKARHLLQEATTNAPNGLDANYFYGDFLYQQREYPEAAKVLKHALALPAHPERPIWDRSRRLVIQELLAKTPK
jgi:tetratricopeptide (TPR) repeat protein